MGKNNFFCHFRGEKTFCHFMEGERKIEYMKEWRGKMYMYREEEEKAIRNFGG